MNKKPIQVMFGLFLVLVGFAYIGDLFRLWDFNLFFDGWWTLFLIVPSLCSMVSNHINTGNSIVLCVGILLLLNERNILPYDVGIKIILPIIIILIGIKLIFKRSFGYSGFDSWEIKNLKYNPESKDFIAIFSGSAVNFSGQEFNGGNTCSIFGGVTLDLSNAIINSDCIISTCDVFGGTDILLPANVKVLINPISVFGGTTNKHTSANVESAPTVYINSVCIFGGTDIK